MYLDTAAFAYRLSSGIHSSLLQWGKRVTMPIAKDLVDAQSGDASTAEEWTRRARRELVGRVVRSPAFARSERLSTLLTYVCDMTLKGRGAELNEQRIGLAVFGRQPDYDSSNDGIVRTQASRLRQRLDQYFSGEGANETVRIEIPKGGYMPIFIEQPLARPGAAELQQQMPAASLPADALVDLPKPRRGWWQAAPWVLCCALALLAAAGWLRGRGAAATAAPQHPLWSRIFTPGRPTLEVPGDSGLVLSYLFTHHGVSLSDYIAGTYRMPARPGVPSEDQSIPTDIANRRYTSIVDLLVAVNLQKIAVRSGSSLQVRYARDLRPNDLKNGNAILIGAFEGNPWLAMFEPQMKFRLVNDYRQHIFSVVNNSPQPSEPRVWQSTANDPLKRVYGVIALMPNLSGDGDVLIIEGTSMAGVEAAWDFVSDDQVLLPVLHRMQKADGTLPSFEILVSTENMGASASKANLVATETHSRQ